MTNSDNKIELVRLSKLIYGYEQDKKKIKGAKLEEKEKFSEVNLPNFLCPFNKDIENFFKKKAILFENNQFSKTTLVFIINRENIKFAGYYSINTKPLAISNKALSKTYKKKLIKNSVYDRESKEYYINATLIGQLSKNFCPGCEHLISGQTLLGLAIKDIKTAQNLIGGRFIYLECEDNQKLVNFYKANSFEEFGRRELDKDEKDASSSGNFLIQLLRRSN